MNGSVLQSGTFLTPSALADVRWGMSGTGDFNLDGKPDILWRHSTSGEIVVWFMNGSVLQSGHVPDPAGLHGRELADRGHGGLQRRREDGHPLAARGVRARTWCGSWTGRAW